MAITKVYSIKPTLKAAIDYIYNSSKTDWNLLVSSCGCTAETADIEFSWTLRQAIDKDVILVHHPIQAFESGEVSAEEAHKSKIILFEAPTRELKKLGAVPLSFAENMKAELANLSAQRETLYVEYSSARSEAKEHETNKQNVDSLLSMPKEQEWEKNFTLNRAL